MVVGYGGGASKKEMDKVLFACELAYCIDTHILTGLDSKYVKR